MWAGQSGRAKASETGSKEDKEQAVCSREQEEEEGLCGWPGAESPEVYRDEQDS